MHAFYFELVDIFFDSRESLRLSCGMNLKMFPVDVQRCNITIGSCKYY